MNLQAIKEAALQIKDKLTKPPLADILIEATSNENWNTPTKLLQEISEASFGFAQCDTIMKFIWKRLDSDNREWRRILKTLNLIEYLTKNGTPRCVGEFRDSIFKIRSFSDFILIEQGSDKGLSIREKSKQLVDLLCDERLIEEERENAKRIRERLAAAGGIGAIGSNTNYQGYGKDTYKNDSYKGYGNDSYTNEASQNKVNESNNNTKSDQQTYQSKYGIFDEGGLDKYKKEETKTKTKNNNHINNHINNNNNNNNTIQWNVPQPEIIQPPFQETIQKLAKPNEKWDVPASKSIQQQPQQAKQNIQPQQQTQKQNVIDIFDIEPQQTKQPQATQIQPLQPPPPPSQKLNNNDWGSFDNVKPQVITQQQTQSQVVLPQDIFSQQVQQQSIQQQQNNLFGQEQQYNQQQQQLQQLYQQQQQYQQPQQYQQQNQNQQANLNQQQQNYQQSLQINYNQQQYNSMNNQQQYFQVNQQQLNLNQQKQTKQEDQVFGDFNSTQQQKQTNSNQIDLLGMLDLKKEKEELEIKKQIPIVNQQIQQNQIYPDLDTFTYNYQKKQQTFSNYQYPQGK